MTKPVTIPNAFANATTTIPLSQLDADFTAVSAAINDPATYANYAADTGAVNAYVVTLNPAPTSLASIIGLAITFKPANTNTGASTLNLNSLGLLNILSADGSALTANQLQAGSIVQVAYDGTQFRQLNVGPASTGASGRLLNTQYFTTASQNVTLTIASPCVVTATAASVPQNGSQIVFATTGALPTGLTAGTVYYVVGSSGTTFNVALTVGGAAINTSGTQSGTQSISSGTYTPTVGTNSVIVETVGGGGGSGGAAADIGLASGGGGGGGYAKKKITSAFSGVTVTVGLGGTAGASGANAGGAGGTSSFGALVSATGGAGGSGATVGFKGVYVALGGSGSSGDFNFSGGASFAISSGSAISFSSTGGASFYSGLISTAYVASNVNGTVGNQYGGGASGALCKTASAQSGATGASGIVIIYEYA